MLAVTGGTVWNFDQLFGARTPFYLSVSEIIFTHRQFECLKMRGLIDMWAVNHYC